ncbi:MAG TPA: hypothetical protein VGV61_09645, partial [Thermoanaerobaculia bacterium]|nr:hypothetical protein [Thermoanaerobaculia bacterium]
MALITGVAEAAREAAPVRPVAHEGQGNAVAGRAVRLLVAALWVALGKLLGAWFLELPVLALFGTTSVTFVTAAVLFGWEGIIAATALQLAYLDVLQGLGGVYPWASSAGYAAAAILAWVTFRYVPRLGRGFPDLRSLGWFAVSTGLGALLSTSIVALTGHEGHVLEAVALWSRSTVVSVWVLAPSLLALGDRRLRRFLAPIPGEQVTTPARRVG